jgi:cytochrome c oxidase assembly protein subunit 11
MSAIETRPPAAPAGNSSAQRSDRRVALWCTGAAIGMLALSFAAVPLYRMFCQVTGFGGTTQRAVAAPSTVLDHIVTVRFDANVAPGLGWRFEPVERTINVRLGENVLVFYRASNTSDRTLTGTASFNVTPDAAGAYFNKLECFCFKEQTLAPGETIEMPVSFFVDPAMLESKDARRISHITLSYTFHPTERAGRSGS